MGYQIKRSGICDLEWHVYAPSYRGDIMLRAGVYEARPWSIPGAMRWPVASFSEINLAADYLAVAVA